MPYHPYFFSSLALHCHLLTSPSVTGQSQVPQLICPIWLPSSLPMTRVTPGLLRGKRGRPPPTGSDLSHFRSLVATFMEPSTGYEFRPKFDQRSSVQPACVSLGRLFNSPAG